MHQRNDIRSKRFCIVNQVKESLELGIPIEAIDNIWTEEDPQRVTEEMNGTSTRA